MKSTTKYLSLAALALMGTLASCQSDDEAATNSFARPANAVGINVSVGSLQTTRSNPAATDPDEAHLFNLGDRVCVSTDGQDPVLFQCTNADQQTWAEAVPGKFLLWKQSEMTFQAYYPATEGTSMTAFTLPADQSNEANIALADYMTRQQTCNNESGTDINLSLERKMARVIVRIAGFNDQYHDDQKTVSNVRIYSQFSGIADGNGGGDITAVNPYVQNGTGGAGTTYTALVVPGDGDSGADFITLTDALNNTLTVKGIPELEVGNSYTFNLTVGKNKILVQSVSVTDWTTGETLAGGQAQEQLSVKVTAITLNKTETSIKVGSTETLSVTAVAPDNATDKTYTWKTSDETKATVDQDGKVTAVAAGTVTIYAEANDGSGVKGNCTVTVTTVAEGHALSASAVGEIVGTDGKAYAVADKDNLPDGVTAVAMVAYKSATAGSSLAIALADEGSMNWNSAKSTCAGKAAIGGKSWKLPTKDEWDQMFSANGGSTGLKTALSAAGGASSTLQNGYYWSSTEAEDDPSYSAWIYSFGEGRWYYDDMVNNSQVRACLAF